MINPVDLSRPGSFGPIASHWPARRALLGGLDPAVLEAPVPELPAHLDRRYFQAAPADQRVDALRGGEWIVLDGMNPALARVQTRLPNVNVRAEWRTVSAGPIHPIDLSADMLVIDADRLLCSVVWRGRFALAGLDALGDIRVSVDIEPTSARAAPASLLPPRGELHTEPPTPASLAGRSDVNPRLAVRAVLPFHSAAHELAATLPLAENATGPERDQPTLPLPSPTADISEARTDPKKPPTGACSQAEALAATLASGDANRLRRTLPFVAADPPHPPAASVGGRPHPPATEAPTAVRPVRRDP